MLQQSPDIEEPDVLNTPRSLAAPPLGGEKEEEGAGRQVATRRLFPDRRPGRLQGVREEGGRLQGVREEGGGRLQGLKRKEGEKEAWQRHPAPTSQVNEYENISPTPSTDLWDTTVRTSPAPEGWFERKITSDNAGA